ncbi:O-antigen polysaccharide polymerase Wzy [Clostridium perfringens]|uniref:O-antigen polysaccharide polymerase Wzy n=1 Tax=Clostridium perfringens TaxID=1502 RepID=UPI0013E3340F|nr:oligosaccharide repeat unit polymerase [Clostridium perfringens]
MKIKKVLYGYGILLITNIILFMLTVNNIINYYLMIRIWTISLIIGVIFIIKSSNDLGDFILSGYNIFLSIGVLFWSGQTILFSLNISSINELEVFKWFNTQEVLKAQIYTTLFVYMFLLGKIIYSFSIKNIDDKYKKIDEKILMKSIFIVGIVMVAASILPYYIGVLENITLIQNNGYKAMYNIKDTSDINNILGFIRNFYVPGLIICYFVSKNRKSKYDKIILSLVIITVVLQFITGARGGAISLLVAFIYINLYYDKKLNCKKILTIACISLTIIIISSIIAQTRVNIEENEVIYTNMNPVVEFIKESGGSQNPLIETMRIIPNYSYYRIGQSYLASIISVIPSFLLFGHSFTQYAALGQWLMKYLNMTYGPGYSIVAECYYNFGYYGIIFAIFLGWCFAKIFYTKRRDNNLNIDVMFIAIILSFSIMSTRNSIYLLIRNIVYLVIIPKFIINIIYKSNLKILRGRK